MTTENEYAAAIGAVLQNRLEGAPPTYVRYIRDHIGVLPNFEEEAEGVHEATVAFVNAHPQCYESPADLRQEIACLNADVKSKRQERGLSGLSGAYTRAIKTLCTYQVQHVVKQYCDDVRENRDLWRRYGRPPAPAPEPEHAPVPKPAPKPVQKKTAPKPAPAPANVFGHEHNEELVVRTFTYEDGYKKSLRKNQLTFFAKTHQAPPLGSVFHGTAGCDVELVRFVSQTTAHYFPVKLSTNKKKVYVLSEGKKPMEIIDSKKNRARLLASIA
jgi:hypothetical protein